MRWLFTGNLQLIQGFVPQVNMNNIVLTILCGDLIAMNNKHQYMLYLHGLRTVNTGLCCCPCDTNFLGSPQASRDVSTGTPWVSSGNPIGIPPDYLYPNGTPAIQWGIPNAIYGIQYPPYGYPMGILWGSIWNPCTQQSRNPHQNTIGTPYL